MFQTKVVEKIKTHILRSVTFCWKSCRLWDNVENYGITGQAEDSVNILLIGYWVVKDPNASVNRLTEGPAGRPGSWFRCLAVRHWISLFSTISVVADRRLRWVNESISPEVKRQGRETANERNCVSVACGFCLMSKRKSLLSHSFIDWTSLIS